jgi:hypothetical protein
MDSERSHRALPIVCGNDDHNGNDDKDQAKALQRRPIECQWCKEDTAAPGHGGRFRVLRARGKTLGAGGYGYYLSSSSSTSLRTDTLATANNTADNTLQSAANGVDTDATPSTTTPCDVNHDTARTSSTTAAAAAIPNPPEHCLFLEEVIYLHERGLLTVVNVSLDELYTRMFHNDDNVSMESRNRSSASGSSSNVSMAAYLVYAHLRSQTFRVVRHTVTRGRLLQDMMDRLEYLNTVSSLTNGDDIVEKVDETDHQEKDSTLDMEPASDDNEPETLGDEHNDQDGTANGVNENAETAVAKRSSKRPWWRRDAQLHAYKQALRRDAAEAPPPRLRVQTTGCPTTVQPAFDCYHPQSNFASACPGPPDFRVAITHFRTLAPPPSRGKQELADPGEPRAEPNKDPDPKPSAGLLFSDLMQLLQSSAIPLKVATVSDSGTVVMFGVADFGAPSLATLAHGSASLEQS